jgi:hypothetical protein
METWDAFAAELQQALPQDNQDPDYPLKLLINDYAAIIGLLDMSVTKLALVLKPPVTTEALQIAFDDIVTQVRVVT